MITVPTLAEIERTRRRLAEHVRVTPAWEWQGERLRDWLAPATRASFKLELLQVTGSFKPRGALAVMLAMDAAALARGVTAVSAGNHAIAVSWCARRLGSSAKVVMPRSANPLRVRRCRELGAEVLLCEDVHAAFAEVERIQREEGRSFVHPFEGPLTALGTASLGVEWLEQQPDLDAVVVPIGGGGLCAGVATALKLARPGCLVFGVEPAGADTMHRSFAAGSPQSIERVTTLADSLGAPHAAPMSFELCRRHLDGLVKVSDDEIVRALALLFLELKLAVEPAGAAATAALLGPLRGRLAGRHVGLLVCGANLDAETFSRHLAAGMAQLRTA